MSGGDFTERQLVFVYGTLKDGYCNNSVLGRADGVKVQDSQVRPGEFTMVDLGAFPALIEDKNGGRIFGEIWEVDSLKPLDRLEGYPTLYDRKRIETDTGQVCWIYFMQDWRCRGERIIESGEWA